jgi:hypothetical protein
MRQKPELEQMIEGLHTIRWQIDAEIVESLLNSKEGSMSDSVDICYLEKASEYIKQAIGELVCPAATRRHNATKPTPMDVLKDVFGL